MTTNTTPHHLLTLLVGGEECLDRECEDYFTDNGEPDPGVERCSHIRTETVCAGCSGEPNADGEYEHTVPWDECTAKASS